jgi:RimJ/RimL family protein N-acetyltransferase
MVVRFVPLDETLLRLALAEGAPDLAPPAAVTDEHLRVYLAGNALGEAMLGDGRVLGAAGLVPIHAGRAHAWLILSRHIAPRQRLAALDRTRAGLDRGHARGWRRIEMQVRADHPWADRFAARLGFAFEAVLRAWDELGRDYRQYVRVVEG